MPLGPISHRVSDLALGLRYAVSHPHIIVILGMHRSGTSCVTRTLNLLGASFGRSEVGETAPDDGEIHWESPTLIWINESILKRSGGSWHCPPSELRPTLRDRWRCRRFLWEFGGSSLAVFKDPRLLLTYPVWADVLPKHTVISCIRNPMSVARSLNRRDHLPIAQGIDLWTEYNLRLREITDCTGETIWFDFDNGARAVKRLVREVTARFDLQPTREALEHYDPAAHHHRDDSDLPADVQDLHASLMRLADSSTAD